MQGTLEQQDWGAGQFHLRWEQAAQHLERSLSSKLSLSRQVVICVLILAATIALGWEMHGMYHRTPVLLCLVASISISLVTDMTVAISMSLVFAFFADLLFMGKFGRNIFDSHYLFHTTAFLSAALLANSLVRILRNAYLQSIEAREMAENTNREKDEIMAILSHDLRAPLTAAQLSLQMIERQLPVCEHRDMVLKHVKRTRDACNRVNALVLDLLDSTKASTGNLPLHRETHDVTALIQSVVNELKVLASQAGIRLEFSGTPSILISCDAHRVSQMMSNLITNALKFTHRGGEVRISITQTGSGVRICVSDTGIGMTETQLSHLFERFWQAERSNRSGVGLGLFIVNAIVTAHSGHIEVTSAPHRGTTFQVELPL